MARATVSRARDRCDPYQVRSLRIKVGERPGRASFRHAHGYPYLAARTPQCTTVWGSISIETSSYAGYLGKSYLTDTDYDMSRQQGICHDLFLICPITLALLVCFLFRFDCRFVSLVAFRFAFRFVVRSFPFSLVFR